MGFPPTGFGDLAGGTIVQATAGGVAAVAGGGKFANGALTAGFQYLATTSLEAAENTNRSAELDNSNYARTYVDFFGRVRAEFLDPFNNLDPISQQSVVVHEGVHVDQLTPFAIEYCPWGCAAVYRASVSYGGVNNMELAAFDAQLNYLNSKLDAVPRSQWTVNYQAADVFRQQVKDNIWQAQHQ